MHFSQRCFVLLSIAVLLILLLVGCGHDDSGDALAVPDTTVPVATITFPGTTALVMCSPITVRGTVLSTISMVAVNGIAATSADGFRTWVAQVPVPLGTSEVVVSTRDGAGHTEERAAVATVTVLESFEPFLSPSGVAVEAGGTFVVTDAARAAIIRVDPITGSRTVVSDSTAGSGSVLNSPRSIAVEAAGRLVVVDAGSRVVRVDPSTGERTTMAIIPSGAGKGIAVEAGGTLVVSSGADTVLRVDPITGVSTIVSDSITGQGPNFLLLGGIAVEADGSLIVLDFFRKVVRVDPVTGDRTLVSGGGPELMTPVDVAVEVSGGLVAVDSGRRAVVRVDPFTGTRTIVSDATTGRGPVFSDGLISIAAEASGNLVVIDKNFDGLIRVDPVTGDRTLISLYPIGSGQPLYFPVGVAVEVTGSLVVVDADLRAVVRVNPVTGERSIVSSGILGTGPYFTRPEGIAVEATGSLVVVDSGSAPLNPSWQPVIRVDPASGNRTLITATPYFSFFAPLSVAVENSGSLLVLNSGFILAGQPGIASVDGPDEVIRLEPVSGPATVVARLNNGSRVALGSGESVVDIAVEATGNLVAVEEIQGKVVGVDLVTGTINTVSGHSTGGGPSLVCPGSIAMETSGTLVVVDCFSTILRVDPVSGDRTIISDANTGTGPGVWINDVAVEASGVLVGVDSRLKAVVRVDPISGDRAIISR